MKRIVLTAFLLCFAFFLFSCAKKNSSPAVKHAISIDIEDSSVLLYCGETYEFKASVRDKSGNPVEDALINWSIDSSTDSVAGSFSVRQTSPTVSTIFTSGEKEYSGKVFAEYKGVKASVNIQIKKMTYSVKIDDVSNGPVFIFKGKTRKFKASVVNARNVPMPDARIDWRVSSAGAGYFNPKSTVSGKETVFTARNNNFNGRIFAEYKNFSASIDLIIGEVDEILVTGTSQYAIKGGETVSFTAVVKANGYTLTSPPKINWGSSNGSIAHLSPSSGQTVNLVPKKAGAVTVTASLASNASIKGSARVTVKNIYEIDLNASFSVRYYGDVIVERSGSEIKIFLPDGGDMAVLRFYNGETKDLRGYTKMKVTLRCENARLGYVFLGMYEGHAALFTSLAASNTVYEIPIKNIDLSNVNEFFYIENSSAGAGIRYKTVYLSKIELL